MEIKISNGLLFAHSHGNPAILSFGTYEYNVLQYTFTKSYCFREYIFRLYISFLRIKYYTSIKIHHLSVCRNGFRLNQNTVNIIAVRVSNNGAMILAPMYVTFFFFFGLYFNTFPAVFSKTVRRRRIFIFRNLITCAEFKSRKHFYLFFRQMALYCRATISGRHVEMRKSIRCASVIFSMRDPTVNRKRAAEKRLIKFMMELFRRYAWKTRSIISHIRRLIVNSETKCALGKRY